MHLLNARRSSKRLLAAISDSLSCVLAIWISFSLRLGQFPWFDRSFLIFLITGLAISITTFFARGVYNNIFRFHGPNGLGQIARSCFVIAVPLVVFFGFISMPGIPRTVSVIFPVIFFTIVAVSRIVTRYFLMDLFKGDEAHQRVLIYGAGVAGRKLATLLQHETKYNLFAYCDDNISLQGQRIEGVPIISLANTEAALKDGQIDLILLALPSLQRSKRAAIVERLRSHGAHVKILPGLHEIVAGEVSVSDLRDIEVTDLLAREPVTPDFQLLGRAITGKTVLVTGAGGSIGSELCRQILKQRPKKLILFEMTEAALFAIDGELRAVAGTDAIESIIVPELGSLVDEATVARLFESWRPNTVYHAAAYKHVPLVEVNLIAGVRNNVIGTLNCAQAAIKANVERFILVSTDKAVRPTNVMGASKRICELILQALDDASGEGNRTIFAMVRFGNVLGSSGSVVPHFRRQIAAGGPVTLTHKNITRYFMTIPEAAELVIQAGAMAEGGEVYLLDMGKPVRIYDLARSMIQMSGRTVRDADHPEGDIEIVEIGLRSGEKLFEELLIGLESSPTDHSRIYRAREEKLTWKTLAPALNSIKRATDTGDRLAIRELLHELVKGYQPDPSGAGPNQKPVTPPEFPTSDPAIARHF